MSQVILWRSYIHPKEKADFVLNKDIELLHHIGDIVTYSSTALQQCSMKKIDCITPAGKAVSFSLSIEAPDSFLLSFSFSFLRFSVVPVGQGDQLLLLPPALILECIGYSVTLQYWSF